MRSAKQTSNVENIYFLVLFACCRESYISKTKISIASDTQDGQKIDSRSVDAKVNDAKLSNFTMVFGCDPAAGVNADTQFVKLFINHMKNLFDPEDGTLMIP
jgi:hypothetical protein